ncbi:MAG: hypothetical protein RID53_07530 [Coleofasciculus sp. B1-GNL1-01]|uniref:hypothetical protein n=1 Tax=Coleofasciculus sp. B1-GNL1-01 TaxID=3068484 RepID=UPI0032F590A4
MLDHQRQGNQPDQTTTSRNCFQVRDEAIASAENLIKIKPQADTAAKLAGIFRPTAAATGCKL